MVVGRRFWNLIWYGILLLGVLGLVSSLYWGRRTHWKNNDELIRSIGTITVSVGMVMLLNHVAPLLGQLLLFVAIVCFVVAFVLGRRLPPSPPDPEDVEDEEGKRA
jgi:O-antigen/teichoic acid export membrane protein